MLDFVPAMKAGCSPAKFKSPSSLERCSPKSKCRCLSWLDRGSVKLKIGFADPATLPGALLLLAAGGFNWKVN